MSNNENLTNRLQLPEKGAMLETSQLEQLERDLIALLYTIWRLTGKQKKVVKLRGDNETDS